jgi:hypothetical protein
MNGEDFITTERKANARGPKPERNYGAHAFGVGNNENSIWSTRYLKEGENIPDGYKSMKDPLNPQKTIIYMDNNFYKRLVSPELWQNYYLRASGGKKVTYNFSMGYKNDAGLVKSTGYSKLTLHGDVHSKINNFIKYEGGFDLNEMKSKDLPSDKRTFFQRTLSIPNTEKVFWPDGLPVHGTNSTTLPPDWYAYYYNRDRKINRFTAYGKLTIDVNKNLNVSIKGANFDRFNRYHGFEKKDNYGNARNAGADISHYTHRTGQVYINYDKEFGQFNRLKFVGGSELNYKINNYIATKGYDGASDLVTTVTAEPTLTRGESKETRQSLLSYFGRIKYVFKNKYIFSANFRADASSKFSVENRWGYFPSISGGWIMSEERFMKGIKKINFLKLRTSYGKTGNNNIGLFDATGSYNVETKYNSKSALYADEMGNNDLKWETTTQLDIGLD